LPPIALRASLVAALLTLAVPAAARADYTGETLSLTQSGASTAGALTTLTASGQDLDAPDYAGGFNLYVFAKNPAVDPTCAPSYWQEEQTYTNLLAVGAESLIDIGDWEGATTAPFSLPVKTVFTTPGPRLVCAYSTWVTDTAAAATLTVNVAGAQAAPTPAPVPTTGGPAPVAKPTATAAPSIHRAGRRLTCRPGTWTGGPQLAFAWLRGRATIAHGAHLTVTRRLRHATVACRVTATDAGGSTSLLSPRLRLR
jgi:hypothetical protein